MFSCQMFGVTFVPQLEICSSQVAEDVLAEVAAAEATPKTFQASAPKMDDDIFAEEKEKQEKQDAEVAASWSKRVLAEGSGREAWQGARTTLHIVGHLSTEDGEIFEDSRSRDVPQLMLLGRGSVVPGLDRALLTMRAGEHALVTVAPEGGYGAAGSHSVWHERTVPGSSTLVYDVEVLKLEEEANLWDQSFEDKMRFAEERRERGTRLFKRASSAAAFKHLYEWADAEYEQVRGCHDLDRPRPRPRVIPPAHTQSLRHRHPARRQAMRYLVYHPHPTPEESEAVGGLMLTVQLNLAATKLRCAREAAALTHCEKALELQPEHPKALYRSAQAHTQLGQPAQAKAFLARLEAAAQGDEEMLKAAAQERARLEHRQERHKRQQKKAYARMVQGHDDAPRGPHRWWRLLRSWAERDDYAGAMALAGAAVVAAFAAALLLLPDWGSTTRQ